MKLMRSLAFMLALLSLLVTNVVAREYSPTTGRYIQFDPTGLDGGWNGYAYVSSDPLGWYDERFLPGDKIPGY
ncbi:RHS repeat-associated core domain-containing protein [Variovorax sp. RA8]|uniref:RHS repeat-associated core domain-containing protein n=1 Tax=Variovorax sp. (strain JCM 16519 / RA8) TaxID=662548 RepID=UPI000A79CF6B|nr:RHS repeat-associated core domain-containing protein [Variovorax sp. RA8]VTU17075.1 RHS repeat-associated core domain protein [Variovorax sp. RA8]